MRLVTMAIVGSALTTLLFAGGCGKKGAPVPPENVPRSPSKPLQDRSSVPLNEDGYFAGNRSTLNVS